MHDATFPTRVVASLLCCVAGLSVVTAGAGTLPPRGRDAPLLYLSGRGTSLGTGDWVGAGDGLADAHRLVIEVPPNTASLVVELFDADVLAGAGDPGEVDKIRGRRADTSARYQLLDPAGRLAAARLFAAGDGGPAADRAWLTLFSSHATGAPPRPGHWTLIVDMSAGPPAAARDDVNALGVRAHDGDPGHGGTELSIYTGSFLPIGIYGHPGSRRDYALFAYVTGGCVLAVHDFDFDTSADARLGSLQLVSRTGAHVFGHGASADTAFSADRAWNHNLATGWTTAGSASEYGIWSLAIEIADPGAGNFATVRLESGADAGAFTPRAVPSGEALRIYLPSDRGSGPLKPFLGQSLAFVDGSGNPPGAGGSASYAVTLRLANPAGTAAALQFESSHAIITSVPDDVRYLGAASPSAGALLAEPARGGGGELRWRPGSVAPGVDATLIYLVEVSRQAGVPVMPVEITGRPGAGGTRAELLDETGTPLVLGELCQLAVPPDVALPTLAPIPEQIADLLR